jgi:hypothetical protein
MGDLLLTQQQRDTIDSLTNDNQQDWWKAYSYTYSIIKDDLSISKDIRVWFQKASEINSNDPYSAANSAVANSGMVMSGCSATTPRINSRCDFSLPCWNRPRGLGSTLPLKAFRNMISTCAHLQ